MLTGGPGGTADPADSRRCSERRVSGHRTPPERCAGRCAQSAIRRAPGGPDGAAGERLLSDVHKGASTSSRCAAFRIRPRRPSVRCGVRRNQANAIQQPSYLCHARGQGEPAVVVARRLPGAARPRPGLVAHPPTEAPLNRELTHSEGGPVWSLGLPGRSPPMVRSGLGRPAEQPLQRRVRKLVLREEPARATAPDLVRGRRVGVSRRQDDARPPGQRSPLLGERHAVLVAKPDVDEGAMRAQVAGRHECRGVPSASPATAIPSAVSSRRTSPRNAGSSW